MIKNKWIKRLATVCFLVSFGTLTYIAGFDRINGGALQSLFGQGTDDAYEGVPEDFTEEAKRITKAAEQGNADAQFLLGMRYYIGSGVQQDYTEAAKWFRKAAEQGYADAQFLLGKQYEQGIGVPEDPREAARWYAKAAE